VNELNNPSNAVQVTVDADDYAGDATTSGQITPGGTAQGNLERLGDRDWFQIQLTAGTGYLINLQGLQGGGGTLDDPYLRLHNSAGTVLAENDDIVIGSDLDSRLSYTAAATGTYYLDAGAYADSYTGTFRLSVAAINRPPVITSNSGGDTATIAIVENTTAVTTVVATDADAGTTLVYSIVGGADQGRFQINASSGAVSFITAPDFEAPNDSDANRSYIVQVRASDGSLADTQTLTVNVSDANDVAPVITTAATQSVAENVALVAALTSTDADSVGTNPAAFSITGGVDAARFSIVGGNLLFAPTPDFENPADADHDNSYLVQVSAFDGVNTANRAITVNVINVVETIFSAVTATVPSSAENLTLTGPANIDGTGNDRDNRIEGNSGNNRLDGRAGSDTLLGAAGDDRLIWSGGLDSFDGGIGIDTADFSAAGTAVWANLPSSQAYTRDEITFATGAQLAALTAIENVVGTARGDFLGGDGLPNFLEGLGGNDTINGAGGDDTIDAGDGADRVDGGAGSDILIGGPGDDVVNGGSGFDTARYSGPKSAYTVTRSSTGFVVSGQEGTDSLTGIERLQFGNVLVRPADYSATTNFNGDSTNDLLWLSTGGEASVWTMNGVQDSGANHGGVAGRTLLSSHADFNGDGRHDIAWKDPDGAVTLWAMNGSGIGAARTFGPYGGWTAIDSGRDFNGDGKSDLLWRHASGEASVWTLDGVNDTSSQNFSMAADRTLMKARVDFNGDGKDDLLWNHAGGGATLWTMNGASTQATASYAYGGWTVLDHQVDFNADGRNDLLWRYSGGEVSVWTMNGVSDSGSQNYSLSTQWSLFDSRSDFNGDGKTDLVWTHSDGSVALWLMNGSSISSSRTFTQPGWSLVDSRNDFNGDGKSDLMWKHANGAVALWTMDGVNDTASAIFGPWAGWSVAGLHADFNGDGKSDLLWRHTNGEISVWTMNGVTNTASQNYAPSPGLTALRMADVLPGQVDFNGDDKTDLIWQDANGGLAMWIMNGPQSIASATFGPYGGWTPQEMVIA
ncbi:MAG: repeat-containing protein, partial [Gemmatimonadetes bacterium]|nr:repeat-containing protein [Gemmatimonadota bacterium]